MKIYKTQDFVLTFLLLGLFLTACSDKKSNVSDNSDKSESFTDFYQKFTTDSLFQLDRVEFPVHGRYMDNEIAGTTESDSTTWTRQNWIIIRAIKKEDLSNLRISKSISDSIAIIKTEGIDFNFTFEETYKRKNGKWYLTNLTDLSL
jgi:hypothetical protein